MTVLLTVGCGPGEPGSGDDRSGLDMVVTTTILGDLAEELVRDDGTVEVLMQPGQDAHAFSASARQARSLRDADLVVAVGLDLEASLVDTLDAAEREGVAVLRVAEEVDPRAFEDPGDAHGEDQSHDEEALDPHVWFDPVRMAEAVRAMAAAMADAAPASAAIDWAARGEALAAEILETHRNVEDILRAVPEPCRVLVTNHDALGYFAARYGFEVLGSVIPGTSTQADPSARAFAELVTTLRRTGVPAIFAETSQPTRLAETLAAEVDRDVEVVVLHTESLGEPGTAAASYTGMLESNARQIAGALAECPREEGGSAWTG